MKFVLASFLIFAGVSQAQAEIDCFAMAVNGTRTQLRLNEKGNAFEGTVSGFDIRVGLLPEVGTKAVFVDFIRDGLTGASVSTRSFELSNSYSAYLAKLTSAEGRTSAEDRNMRVFCRAQ